MSAGPEPPLSCDLRLNHAKNEPKIRLQLDSLQVLASNGFVLPPAIEPNHDMCHPKKPVEQVSIPIGERNGPERQMDEV